MHKHAANYINIKIVLESDLMDDSLSKTKTTVSRNNSKKMLPVIKKENFK